MGNGEPGRESVSDQELSAALHAARGVTPEPSDLAEYLLATRTLPRRDVVTTGATIAAVAVTPGVIESEETQPTPSTSPATNHPAPSEHTPTEPHEENHGEGNHAENDLTSINAITAFVVAANFFEMLAESTLIKEAEDGHGEKTRLGRKPLGPSMILQSAAGEALRLAALFRSKNSIDHHTAEHEIRELTKSLTVASCLPILADAASRMRAEARALDSIETPMVDRIMKTFSPEISEEAIVRPSVEAGAEEWGEYADRKLKHFYERVALLGGSAASQATFTTTYNSSGVANTLKIGAAEEYAEWVIAREMHARKLKNPSGRIDTREIYSLAEKATYRMVNDPAGLTNLAIALCSNWDGNDFPLADPPNIFNAIAHFGELPRTMAQGFGLKVISNMFAFNFFLARYTGISNTRRNEVFFLGQFFSSSIKGLKALPDIFRDMKREDLVVQADRLRRQWENLYSNGGGIQKLAELMRTISSVEHRTPLHLPAGETAPGRLISAGAEWAKRLIGRGTRAKDTHRDTRTLKGAYRLFLDEIAKSKALPGAKGKRAQDAILKILSPSDLQDFVLDYQFDHPNEGKTRELADMFRHLEGLIHADTEESIREAIGIIGRTQIKREDDMRRITNNLRAGNYIEVLRILNTSNALNLESAILEMNQPARGRDSKHEILTETGKEVARALSIQIPNVEALVTVVKFILEKPALKSLPFDVKSGIILMISAQISRVADNVAAYLFGEKTLEALAASEFGEEIKGNSEFMASLHRQALYAAIVGGGLSKFGNGPNFLHELLETKIGNDGVIEILPKKLPIASTFKNIYAELLTFMVCGLGMGDISLYSPNQKERQPTR